MHKRILMCSLLLYFTFVAVPSAMGQTYIIKPGDTLWNLAQKFNTTVSQLQTANKLKSPNLAVGAVLTIPSVSTMPTNKVSSSDLATAYSVKAGDSLWSIAKQFNVTTGQLETINNLSSETLQIGQRLSIPAAAAKQITNQTVSATPAVLNEPDLNQDKRPTKYTIKKGDSLLSIAGVFDISVEEICNNNNLADTLKVGQVITIPQKLIIEIPAVADRSSDNRVSSEPARGSSLIRDLLAEAGKYIGTPYQSAGITPEGFDCSGFVYYVFKAVGINMPRSSSEQSTIGQAIDENELQPGDLVFFCTNGSPTINHVGICIEDNRFIHCSSNKGVVVNNLDDTYYRNCYSLSRRVY